MPRYFSPDICARCETKCLNYNLESPRAYTVDILPTNWECENAKLLQDIPKQKNGKYRFNTGFMSWENRWFEQYMEGVIK